MSTQSLTIDCQVHCYERNSPERPWHGHLEGPEEMTGADMIAAMDSVGVDGAILISPFAMYQYDASYALQVYASHPNKFGLVRPFDPSSDSISDDVAQWAATPGVVGARIMLNAYDFEADHPGLNAFWMPPQGGTSRKRHGFGKAAASDRIGPSQSRYTSHH